MIKTQTCHTIHCDGSGCEATIEHDFTPHYPDAEYAREEARETEWWCQDGVDLCDSCKLSPHAFVPEIAGRDDVACDRCGLDQDEHELETGRQPLTAPWPVGVSPPCVTGR